MIGVQGADGIVSVHGIDARGGVRRASSHETVGEGDGDLDGVRHAGVRVGLDRTLRCRTMTDPLALRRKAAVVLGIDGCPGGGWVVARLSQHGQLSLGHAPDVTSLAGAAADSVLALVDIPIGLVDGPRACDVEARQIIGPRRSSVFPAPPRWLLDCDTLEAADAAMADHGRKRVQRQLWNIVARIREVDGLLRSGGLAPGRLRECHPELCFRTLRGRVLEHSKHSRDGLALRREIIAAYLPGAAASIDEALSSRSPWKEDDVLDACIAAITAAGVWTQELSTIPARPSIDACGLPMEMVVRWPSEQRSPLPA